MASANLPPRQKMINMMYLVLTAILALNVSKEVLDSFATLDADLVRSEQAHEQRSRIEYSAFDDAARDFPDRYAALRDKAYEMQSDADSLVKYLGEVKAEVIAKAEGRPLQEVVVKGGDGRDSVMALAAVEMKDDRDVLTRMLVGSEPASPREGRGSARDIKQRIEGFRDRLKSYCATADPALATSLDLLFTLRDGKDASGTPSNWETLNFHDVPLAAGIATLSKLQADVRSAENDMLKWLYRSGGKGAHLMSTLVPAVIPQSSVVMVGDSFRADVFLAAYDEKDRPRMDRRGDSGPVELPVGSDGKGKLRLRAERVGEQKVEGVIHLQGPNGPEEHPYSVTYQVMAPLLVISPTKMNVLYRGVDNPIELSVPGVTIDRISPSTDNGTVTRMGEGWVARVNTLGTARFTVRAAMPDGSVRSIGPVVFRVKDLPPPQAIVNGVGSGATTIKKTVLTAAPGILCKLGLDTDFDEPFRVTRYTVSIMKNGNLVEHKVNSNRFDERTKEMLQALRTGDRVWFEEIQVELTNGKGRKYDLAPIALKVVP
ncbi:MAG TPA: gliding motility protein GldM [Flavobacteriales bacterium]